MSTAGDKIKPWWLANKQHAHEDLIRLVEHLETESGQERRQRALRCMALYGDRYALRALSRSRTPQRLRFNLVKSVVDAWHSEIAGAKPKPTILTQRGDWSQKRRAQQMELMVEGEYDANDVYTQAAQGVLDAAKVGTTGFKVFQSGYRPALEVHQPGSILVDPAEGIHGRPKAIYQIGVYPKYEAIGRFGTTERKQMAIENAPAGDHLKTWFPWLPRDSQVPTVLLVEAWREPDPDDWESNGKGRHVIACVGGTLVDEDWDRPQPHTFYRYDREAGDFYGRSMVENLDGLQIALNRTLRKIEDAIELAAGPRVWVEAGSQVDVDQITDRPGSILYYTGVPPTIEVSNTVPEQLFRHVEDVIRRGFEQEGVSMMSAMSRKPAGLNSGAALREHNDIESRRFRVKAQAFEKWIGVDTAERMIEEKRWIAENYPGKLPKVQAQVRRGRSMSVREIDWKDATLDPGTYSMRVFPSSALPNTPAGRIATVEQWIGSGLVSREHGMQLLDFPDLEDYVSRELSTQELVLYNVETMLEDGEYTPPSPLLKLEYAIDLASQATLRAEVDGVPEEGTELLYRYIDDLRAYQDRAQQAAMEQQAAMQGQPQINQASATQMATAQA